jgi:hypothetical protein
MRSDPRWARIPNSLGGWKRTCGRGAAGGVSSGGGWVAAGGGEWVGAGLPVCARSRARGKGDGLMEAVRAVEVGK